MAKESQTVINDFDHWVPAEAGMTVKCQHGLIERVMEDIED